MITYKEFLKSCDIISEEDFNELVKLLPDVEINENIYFDDPVDTDSVNSVLIDKILDKWNYCWADDVSAKDRTFYLYDVETLSDLKEIKELFTNWTIGNYEDLEASLKKEEEEHREIDEKEKLLDKLSELPIEELRLIVNKKF